MAGGSGMGAGGAPSAANNTMPNFGAAPSGSKISQISGNSLANMGAGTGINNGTMSSGFGSNPSAMLQNAMGSGVSSVNSTSTANMQGLGGTQRGSLYNALGQIGMGGFGSPNQTPMSQLPSQAQMEAMSPAQRQQWALQFQAQERAAQPWLVYGTQYAQENPQFLQQFQGMQPPTNALGGPSITYPPMNSRGGSPSPFMSRYMPFNRMFGGMGQGGYGGPRPVQNFQPQVIPTSSQGAAQATQALSDQDRQELNDLRAWQARYTGNDGGR